MDALRLSIWVRVVQICFTRGVGLVSKRSCCLVVLLNSFCQDSRKASREALRDVRCIVLYLFSLYTSMPHKMKAHPDYNYR